MDAVNLQLYVGSIRQIVTPKYLIPAKRLVKGEFKSSKAKSVWAADV